MQTMMPGYALLKILLNFIKLRVIKKLMLSKCVGIILVNENQKALLPIPK